MAEPELPRPPSIASLSIASLPKNPSEVKGTTSQGVLDKESRPGGIVPEADEKAELDNEDHAISDQDAAKKTANRHLIYDLTLLFCTFIMLLWPWVFFGAVYAAKGIQMNNHLAKIVTDHPHSTTFFATLIANVVCLLINILFSFAVIRFSQEWIATHEIVTVFDVELIMALRHQTWPWSLKDIKKLIIRNRVLPVVLAATCIGTYTFIPSGLTSLITPVPFNKNATLQGVELDLSSSKCFDWLEAHNIPNNCDWQTYKSLPYTNCLGQNQMVDTLESGRGNILSLISNNSQSLSFSQLGSRDGLHFLGPIRGVLPIGPNGVPAFDTLGPSPFSNNKTAAGIVSYNYTLEHQGLASGVSCSYADQSPIRFGAVPGVDAPWVLQYNATCDSDGKADVLTDVLTLIVPNANNTLAFWACQSPPAAGKSPTYFIYLRGKGAKAGEYQDSIGNITCTVSPIHPAIYPVTYQSLPRIFSMTESIANATQVYPTLIKRALVGLSGIIHEAQNSQANLVAESVITFGVKSFGLRPYEKNETYLELYQSMIQGILEYEATYLRVIWSTVENRPDFCNRTVNGTVSYEVIGWSAVPEQIGFLMPITFFDIGAMVIIIMAMIRAKGDAYEHNPASLRSLLATREGANDLPEWTDPVIYRRRDVTKALLTEFKDKTVDAGTEAIGGSVSGIADNVLKSLRH